MIFNFKNFIVLMAVFFLVQGCGLKAPDVSIPSSNLNLSKENANAENTNCTDAEKWCQVSYSLRMGNSDGMWVYWQAGNASVELNPSKDFIASKKWDLRLTRFFPIVGSNGGETIKDTKSDGAIAALSADRDASSNFIPTRVSEIQDWEFVSDTFESLDPELAAGYQNPLLNKIGSGILKSYNMATHAVELSNRPFVLKTADGLNYYVLKFDLYARAEKVFGFHWKKLKGN